MAKESGIEVVEFPKLARAVYYTTRINQQIPFQLYRAIAHVLTYTLQLKSWRAGQQDRPHLNQHISIPQEALKQDTENVKRVLTALRGGRLGVPLVLLCILAMVILPLPPMLLDILFTFNIVLAVLVLLVSVSTKRPLDFSLFPTVLLITTLMRLTLNVASTRVVLLFGHEGVGAAGKVIESFGQVVIGGNFVVGFVVFIILMIINFIVVTKGAERISEVSARFTLDAMPGKQMAIDADLNAGLINQAQAQARRKEVAGEADFYGAMDGASKFVRGDAIAGMMILAINMIGGICIGIFKHDLSAEAAFQQYVLMTIGDGLVAQIPSLLLSTAAAVIVTRISDSGDIATDVRSQLLATPSILYTAAGVMFVLAIVPGMPHLPFLAFTALLCFVAWRQSKRPQVAETDEKSLADLSKSITETAEQQVSWETIPLIEPISLSLGYKLVSLVDKTKGNPLTQRIRGVRQVISDNNGVLLPEIRIRENFRLKPTQYAIYINGINAAEGEVPADRLMALPSSETYGEIDGVLGTDPAYGMPVTWIQPTQKAKALNLGYQVIDTASVIATHVNKTVRNYIPELFNYDDITYLHNRLGSMAPRLAEDLGAALNYGQLLKVYRQLLTEGVSLRDIVTVATVLVTASVNTKDPILLTSDVRLAMRRSITQSLARHRELSVYTLNNELENLLLSVVNQAQQGGKTSLDSVPVDPNMLGQFQANMPQIQEQMKAAGKEPVLLVAPLLRPLLSRYARLFAPGLQVLSYNEVPDELELKILGSLT